MGNKACMLAWPPPPVAPVADLDELEELLHDATAGQWFVDGLAPSHLTRGIYDASRSRQLFAFGPGDQELADATAVCAMANGVRALIARVRALIALGEVDDRCTKIRKIHAKESGVCTECMHDWPCPTMRAVGVTP